MHHNHFKTPVDSMSLNLNPQRCFNNSQLLESADEYVENSNSHSQTQNKHIDNYKATVYNEPTTTSCTPQFYGKFQNKTNNSINVKININVRTSDESDSSYNINNICDGNEGKLCSIERDENNVYNIVTSSSSSSNFDIINNTYKTSNSQQQNLNARKLAAKKQKLGKLGTKTVGLKRVSFGSSKGSMVETLVFETPTPLSEYAEPNFSFTDCEAETNILDGLKANDDSGIEIQEETGHSVVRVSIYQSNQPQQIYPPSYYLTTNPENLLNSSLDFTNYNYDNTMTTASSMAAYNRHQSTDSGWENPFRPGGDLSREADEIVKMISGGKPITPTDDHTLKNDSNNAQKTNAAIIPEATSESVIKRNVSQSQATQNGANYKTSTSFNGKVTKSTDCNNQTYSSTSQISKQVVPGPTSASHVLIDEKKNKRKGCCVIQ